MATIFPFAAVVLGTPYAEMTSLGAISPAGAVGLQLPPPCRSGSG